MTREERKRRAQGERLKAARIEAGYKSAREAAIANEWPESTYRAHENGTRTMGLDDAERYVRRYRTASAQGILFGEGDAEPDASVPIIGKAGAGPGGEVVFSDSPGLMSLVAPLPGVTETTVVLEVEGDSMRGIANDGWLVMYDDVRDAPSADLFGELCVVRLESGRTLVKFLYPGREPGLYDLESSNAETMRDVAVEWAAPVTGIVPRRAARRLMRSDPSVGNETGTA